MSRRPRIRLFLTLLAYASALRVGGSFVSVTAFPDGGGGTPPSTQSGAYYEWQKWTGPPWRRPSVGAVWDQATGLGQGYSLVGTYGGGGVGEGGNRGSGWEEGKEMPTEVAQSVSGLP